MDLCLWKESKWEDTNEEDMRSYNRNKGRVCTKEEEGISIVKGGERGDTWVYWRKIEKRVYQTLKVISNSICIFCRKKEQ